MKKFIAIFVCVSLLFSCNDGKKTAETTTEKSATETTPPEPKDYEIGSDKYADMGKKGQNDLASGHIDSWMNDFADSAIYRWNAGDSLAGKAAITAYWKKRRSEARLHMRREEKLGKACECAFELCKREVFVD